jgi:hypothetical protein
MNIVSNLLPTVLVVLTGLLTWFLKDKSEKLKFQREKLVEEKRNNYEKVLEPIIRTFSGIKNKNEMLKATKQIQSFEYKKTSFQLMLFGSDAVVSAYNDFFQYLYKNESNLDSVEMLHYLGRVVLSIRKDLGNDKTVLKEFDMLRFLITDIDKLTEQHTKY